MKILSIHYCNEYMTTLLTYYKIIENYFKLSGIPIIVNTSFNLHEFISNSLYINNDAIRAFKQKAVDVLAIGNYWVE